MAALTDGGSPRPAADEVAPQVYDELKRVAAAYMRRERPGQTLQATALVHEAVMGMSPATLKRRWSLARAWLFRELSDPQ